MRKHEWPQLLAEHILEAHRREFEYGAFDCCLFGADWVKKATGVDHAAELRGYASKDDAYKIIERYGSMEAMVTQLLGSEPIHPAFAQRGDLMILINHPAIHGAPECLGICDGLHSAFPAKTGIKMIRTLQAAAGWRV